MSSNQAANLEFLESLYQQFKTNPAQLDPSWQQYFRALEESVPFPTEQLGVQVPPSIEQLSEAYRTYGHRSAKVNPLASKASVEAVQLPTQSEDRQLNEHIQFLQDIYSGSIGFEFKGIQNPELEQWIQQRIESPSFRQQLSTHQKQVILEYLNKSELLESFLHMKYVGQKRFSLEGAETLIPMLALLIEKGVETGLKEIVLGMAHRGRINVLSNILNKSPQKLFFEFDEGYIPQVSEGSSGDVKYHKGYIADFTTTTDKKVKITLTPNPSHLESVDPVVEGQTRAKQFLQGDEAERKAIIPILIHGDAALTGQGVVYETLQFCQLPGYTTGGTLHFVINNQIGFTTIPRDLRSTYYCTDIARAFGAPVFHVNAEDPEACVIVSLLALEIRQTFHCDVFIDLICYRKYGHNETDEPAFTQPVEYQEIKKKKPIREIYRDRLIEQKLIEKPIVEKMEKDFRQKLQDIHTEVVTRLEEASKAQDWMEVPTNQLLFSPFPTGVDKELLIELAKRFSTIPNGFHVHPKVEQPVKERLSAITEDKPIEWGVGEYLAYASLLWEGVPIRLAGQDSCRGTFSHRHAIWVNQTTDEEYFPLAHLKKGQGRFEIINSSLSELAVLGFEYGYSVACLDGLTIWEAQFGDFGNGAQVIIDQYIASGEQKWGQKSGLVMLLPHGYEGQGPEHSSARLERFLTLAGHDNIQVVNPTTPAQLFHLLRRQVLRPLRKPLVVLTPKGLLRHPACVSRLDDLAQGSFQEILDDPTHPQQATRLILCSGRIYYDLIAHREKTKASQLAIVRIEQLYPLHIEKLKEIIQSYPSIEECLWVQEEHQNMGAWNFIRPYLDEVLPKGMPLRYVGRAISASPATGSHSIHKQEHEKILKQVFQV